MNSIENPQNNTPIPELPELDEEDWKKIAEQSADEEKNKPKEEIFDNESPGAWVKEAINLSSLFEVESEKDEFKEDEHEYDIDQKRNIMKIKTKQEELYKLRQMSVEELLTLQQQLNTLNPANMPAANRHGLIKAQRFINKLIVDKNKKSDTNIQVPASTTINNNFYNPLAKSSGKIIKAERVSMSETRKNQELIEEGVASRVYEILQKSELQEELFNGEFSVDNREKELLIEFDADNNVHLNCNINIVSMKNLEKNIDKKINEESKRNVENYLSNSNDPIYFNLIFDVNQTVELFNKDNIKENDIVKFIKNQMQEHFSIFLLGVLTKELGDSAEEDINKFREKLIDNKIDFTASFDEFKKYIEEKLPENKKGSFMNKLLFTMNQLVKKEQVKKKDQVA